MKKAGILRLIGIINLILGMLIVLNSFATAQELNLNCVNTNTIINSRASTDKDSYAPGEDITVTGSIETNIVAPWGPERLVMVSGIGIDTGLGQNYNCIISGNTYAGFNTWTENIDSSYPTTLVQLGDAVPIGGAGAHSVTLKAPLALGLHYVNVQVLQRTANGDGYWRIGFISIPFNVGNSPPIAPTCTINPSAIVVGQVATLTGNGGIGAYTFSTTTGDGGTITTSGTSTSVSYTSTGTKTITVSSGSQTGTCTAAVNPLPPGTCANGDSQIIMRLFTQTNSHVSPASDTNALIPICYDSLFGVKYTAANEHACGANDVNKVIGISNIGGNAHAEGPLVRTTSYQSICYGDLVCTMKSACSANEVLVASLSDTTNAHIAKDNSFNNKICCTRPGCNNGVRDANEDCGEPGFPTCASGYECRSCACTAPRIQAGVIQTALWHDSAGNVKTAPPSADLSESVNMFGDVSGYDLGTAVTVEVYNTNNVLAPIKTIPSEVIANPNNGFAKIDEPLSLSELVANGKVAARDNIYFKLVHKNNGIPDSSAQSENLLLTSQNSVQGCLSLLSASECTRWSTTAVNAAKTETVLPQINGCFGRDVNDGHSGNCRKIECSCEWNPTGGDNGNGDCSSIAKRSADDVLQGYQATCGNARTCVPDSCSIRTQIMSSCTGGYRTVNLIATPRVDATNPCNEILHGELQCATQNDVRVPCGRSLAVLPFFGLWQFIGAVIVLIVLYIVFFRSRWFVGQREIKRRNTPTKRKRK